MLVLFSSSPSSPSPYVLSSECFCSSRHMCSQVSGTLLFSIFFTYVVITVIFKVVYFRLKSGVRKAELRGDSRQVRHWIHWNIFLERETSVYLCLLQAAPPAGHGQVSHLPTPSIPDMTAKVWIVIFDKQKVLSYFHWAGKPCFLSELALPGEPGLPTRPRPPGAGRPSRPPRPSKSQPRCGLWWARHGASATFEVCQSTSKTAIPHM